MKFSSTSNFTMTTLKYIVTRQYNDMDWQFRSPMVYTYCSLLQIIVSLCNYVILYSKGSGPQAFSMITCIHYNCILSVHTFLFYHVPLYIPWIYHSHILPWSISRTYYRCLSNEYYQRLSRVLSTLVHHVYTMSSLRSINIWKCFPFLFLKLSVFYGLVFFGILYTVNSIYNNFKHQGTLKICSHLP